MKPVTPATVGGGWRNFAAACAYYSGMTGRLAANFPWRILRYQRVIEPRQLAYPPLPGDFVTRESFEMQMKLLSKRYHPISITDIFEHLRNGKALPPRAIVVTFDSGWADTYQNALPVLKKYRIPATIFLATAFTDTNNLFWRDKFAAGVLYLEQCGVDFPQIPALVETFEKMPPNAFAQSMARIHYLIQYLEEAPVAERTGAMTAIGIGLESVGGLPLERMFLSWDEVRELNSLGFTFGSNGHSHRTLEDFRRDGVSSDSRSLLEDVKTSFEVIQNAGVSPLPIFAYPEGLVTKEGREALQSIGINMTFGVGDLAFPKEKREAIVFGRLPIHESNAFAKSIYACRLAGAKIMGETF